MNEYDNIWFMSFDSIDWVVRIRGIGFLFGCKNILFSINGL